MKLNRGKERVLVIPDLQIPYEHKDALQFIEAIREEVAPTKIICIGDEVDQMALSRFDPDPDADNAGPELLKARKVLANWYESFPDVSVCHSNHTERVYKAAFRAGIPESYMRSVNEWLDAPESWVWEQNFLVDEVKYEHGDAQGGMYAARNLAIRNRRSTVIGHHHSHGCVNYVANDDEMIFGMNVGCLIDVTARAFIYGRKSAFKPTLGAGVVLEGVPYFVPMLTTRAGRWTGDLVL